MKRRTVSVLHRDILGFFFVFVLFSFPFFFLLVFKIAKNVISLFSADLILSKSAYRGAF